MVCRSGGGCIANTILECFDVILGFDAEVVVVVVAVVHVSAVVVVVEVVCEEDDDVEDVFDVGGGVMESIKHWGNILPI